MAINVLVVDDEIDTEILFQQRFRRQIKSGEMVFNFATSGEDALTFLAGHSSEAVLILSDINMPGMSGLQLLEKIKQKFISPPPVVMMVTAYGDSQNYNEAMRLGADDFLTKPLDFDILKQKLLNKIHDEDISSR